MRHFSYFVLLLMGCGQVQRDSLPGGVQPFGGVSVRTLETGSAPLFVAAADLDGLGRTLLIASDRTNNRLQIVDGTSVLREIPLSNSPGECAVADFVGDSRLDLAVALRDGTSVTIFDGGDSSLATSVSVGTSPQGMAAADLDGDGRQDLVVSNVGSHDLTVLWGQAGGGLGSPLTLSCGLSPVQVLIQDANGDSQLDLLCSNFGSGSVSCFHNQGGRNFSLGQTLAVGNSPFGLAGADFNGDGKPDLAVANELDGTITRYLMGESSLGSALSILAGSKPDCLLSLDVNHDNLQDLLVTLEEEKGVAVLLGDGRGEFSRAGLIPTAGGPVGIVQADLDRSGAPQAVTANFFGQGLSVLTFDQERADVIPTKPAPP